jgi:hypothetical protein
MSNNHTYRQPWLYSVRLDGLFILLPPFFSLLLIALLPGLFAAGEVNHAWWIVLVLCVDVAHVYSTLFRTYFDRVTFRQQRGPLVLIPLLAFTAAVMLYSFSALWFWRVLAYAAVYHFIRQQYGFIRIYSRGEPRNKWYYYTDTVAVYAATAYPVLYWHLNGPRNFEWFIQGDFFQWQAAALNAVAGVLYWLIAAAYIVKEIIFVKTEGWFNWPRNAVMAGTFLSWYFGIVYFNGDMAFTLLNVVSHGVPYMALVWVYGKKRSAHPAAYTPGIKRFFGRRGIVLFLLLLCLLAFVEEALWDTWVWKDRGEIFGWLRSLQFDAGSTALNIIVPLLALPQLTHYIIDGYIWKVSKGHIPERAAPESPAQNSAAKAAAGPH